MFRERVVSAYSVASSVQGLSTGGANNSSTRDVFASGGLDGADDCEMLRPLRVVTFLAAQHDPPSMRSVMSRLGRRCKVARGTSSVVNTEGEPTLTEEDPTPVAFDASTTTDEAFVKQRTQFCCGITAAACAEGHRHDSKSELGEMLGD